jgi:hypothetical protein
MTIKASGRSALILATGLFVCFAGPSYAAATADGAASTKPVSLKPARAKPDGAAETAKHATRHWKKVEHRRSSKTALKSMAPNKAPDVAADNGGDSTALPPSVANANARLPADDPPSGNAKAMTAQANAFLQAAQNSSADAQSAVETQVVAADQLNDVDRTLHDSRESTATQTMAAADVPAAPAMAASHETSTWDQTSLIGKIFIGFGALLTMASAARMFMA